MKLKSLLVKVFNMKTNKEKTEAKKVSAPTVSNGSTKIIPLKDGGINRPNHFVAKLKKGIEIEVPDIYLAGLKSDKVIE